VPAPAFNLRRRCTSTCLEPATQLYQHLPLTCDAAVPAPAFNLRRSCTSTCL
ncbi:hypothetical protein BgiMline_021485, partial [Biomphalaria glabrata]